MKKHKIRHKTGNALERIEKLLDTVKQAEKQELPYTPSICTNECILRQKGFCMAENRPAPRYGEACFISKERA